MINFKDVVPDWDNSHACVVPLYGYTKDLGVEAFYFNKHTMLIYETDGCTDAVMRDRLNVWNNMKLDDYSPLWVIISDQWFAGSLKYDFLLNSLGVLSFKHFFSPYGICVSKMYLAMKHAGCNKEFLKKLKNNELNTIYIQTLVEY